MDSKRLEVDKDLDIQMAPVVETDTDPDAVTAGAIVTETSAYNGSNPMDDYNGWGSGLGFGHGYGFGNGYGYGFGYGDGWGDGDGDGDSWGKRDLKRFKACN